MTKVTERFEAELMQIELAVMRFFDDHPELTDAQVDSVYEELARRYRAEATDHPFQPAKLSDLRLALHEQVLPVTELLRGRPKPLLPGGPISPEDLRQCLNRLRSSIKTWSREAGRQGYLTYLGQFLGG